MYEPVTVTTIRLPRSDRQRLIKLANELQLTRTAAIQFLLRATDEEHAQKRVSQAVLAAVKSVSRRPVQA